ncbi:MAG: energy transducer TonB [Rhodocyclales bacterium]|nr:energy transducer TonB [Rhodocyclales bacterium]
MIFDSGEKDGFRDSSARRRLRYAVFASLFVHALVVFQGMHKTLPQTAPPNLLATLRPVAASAATAPESAPAVVPRIIPPRHAVAPAPTFVAPNAAAPAVAAPPSTDVADIRSLSPSNEAQRATPATQTAPAAATAVAPASLPAPAPADAGLSVDGMRRYRLSLAAQARRFKRYPAQALASGWAGTAEIRLEIGSDGQPKSVEVLHSSGYAVLDRSALTMIEAGARHTPVPAELRGKAFSVVLPVVFDLTES